eukprot:TRINITY_DN1747_c3_g1_i1.p1 TRINITY_DN1747_c3_g1~~TRINITY_DN1747_c3_g1_i1.p1  ORF type:complete len:403 (+),score=41.64 TRINITY_DN1747_c3_g1_i1:232-1440(+)
MSIVNQHSVEAETEIQVAPLSMKELQDLQITSFNNWCSKFAQCGVKYRVVEISQQVLKILQQDGIFMHEGDRAFGTPGKWDECDQWSDDESASDEQSQKQGQNYENNLTDSKYNNLNKANNLVVQEMRNLNIQDEQSGKLRDQQSQEIDDENNMQFEEIRRLKMQIDQCIRELGGEVIPKLNWSAPIDALWSNQNQLKCRNSDEVMLQVQCSDRIGHDLDIIQQIQEFNPNFQCFLVLKQFVNLRPEREFRCFVRDFTLVGISQRHIDQFFSGLENSKDEFQQLISDFFAGKLVNQLSSDNFDFLSDFVFDVYIQNSNSKVILMDIGIVGGSTQSLLFDWDELYGENGLQFEFRINGDDQQGVINKGQAIFYGVPYEFACGSQKVLSGIAEQAREWWRDNCN